MSDTSVYCLALAPCTHARHTAAADNGAKSFDYFQGQRQAIFCLAAAGWGWGQRMKIGITHGCLPVIVQVRAWMHACAHARAAWATQAAHVQVHLHA